VEEEQRPITTTATIATAFQQTDPNSFDQVLAAGKNSGEEIDAFASNAVCR